jgi:hypothetical protein
MNLKVQLTVQILNRFHYFSVFLPEYNDHSMNYAQTRTLTLNNNITIHDTSTRLFPDSSERQRRKQLHIPLLVYLPNFAYNYISEFHTNITNDFSPDLQKYLGKRIRNEFDKNEKHYAFKSSL